MHIWAGTSGFQYAEWKGGFYPEKISAAKMLPYYAEHFPTTEINYSFRQIPSEKAISNWAAATPDRFRFSFKAPQKITHFARLRHCSETLKELHGAIKPLDEKLGVVLCQLPPNFQKDIDVLKAFLEEWPAGLRVAFEFRHASWFDDGVFALLKTHGAALCIAEDADLAAPQVATADFGYLRLRREDYTAKELASWAAWIHGQKSSWKDAFIYFKHEDTGTGPRWAAELTKALEAL